MKSTDMKTEALILAQEHKFRVLPVQPPTRGNPKSGKIPLIKDWVNQATLDPETIGMWWEQWPNASVGIATGQGSKLLVLDVDLASRGVESLEKLKESAADWPETMMVRTGSGGLHLYFFYDGNPVIRNSASKLAPGLDVRADGGYVVAPPSLHASGNRYEWIV